MDKRLPRKLAAILYADVAGYSRLTGDDEDATHKALSQYLDLITLTIQTHHGDVMHFAGDAVLARFEAVVDAVSAAIAIQEQLREQNADLPESRQLQFRIGVNLGDVIEDRGDIYGDGVNIAARLEALADPGGICVSDAVRSAVGKNLGLVYEDMGEQQVKNIEEAVRAFKIVVDTVKSQSAPVETTTLVIPDEPSIAVLPFTNMSNDPEQEFFSDGITEDIITALSKVSSFMVVARNSTFIYKNQAVDIKQVGRDQGVRHVLEGSVRKSGGRVRITAQLIDATTGQHKWAERYDRDLEDIFAVQDEITRNIVAELDIHLLAGEEARFWSSGTENLEAWEYFRRARYLFGSYQTENLPEVKQLVQKALDLDPEYASAWALLSGVNFQIEADARYSRKDRDLALQMSHDNALKAIQCDPSCAVAYSDLGLYYLNLKEFDKALENAEISVEMAPSNANIIAIYAVILNKSGQAERAIERMRKAMRLCPVYPLWFLSILGQILRVLGRLDEAIKTYSEMIERYPDSLEGQVGLAEILGRVGGPAATQAAAEVLRINPAFSIKEYIASLSYRDPDEITRFQEGLRKAGLPE